MPGIDELKRAKNELLHELTLLRADSAKARTKRARELANDAAQLEAKIAHQLLSASRVDDACVNLISQASCLALATRHTEARRVYLKVLELTEKTSLRNWLQSELTRLQDTGFDAHLFERLKTRIADNEHLREPQRDSYSATRDFFARKGTKPAIIQLPVGCGKTGAIALTPVDVAAGRVLVLAPNVEIRNNLALNIDPTKDGNFWKKAHVLSNSAAPRVAYLDKAASVHDVDDANVLVANIQQITSKARWLEKFAPDYFDMILVDEAHHTPAESWKRTLERFPAAKLAQFTATPMRSDGQEIPGERIYRYPIERAIRNGYIKDLCAHKLEPSEIYFTYRGVESRHSLSEVIKLREETWFSRGVALSRTCNEHVVDASIQSRNRLRAEGHGKSPHQIIGVACSVDHAKTIRSLYEERGLEADVIYSAMRDADKSDVLDRLSRGKTEAIVQVGMLGEGADYPTLSVAALFRPFRNIVPYMQFVGRTMRAVVQNSPGHPDNRAIVVAHAGLNVDRWWDQLKEFDDDDREILASLGDGSREFNQSSSEGNGTRRFKPDLEVLHEQIELIRQEHFLGRPLSSVERDSLVQDVIQTLRLKGIDPDALGVSAEAVRAQLEQPEEGLTEPLVPSPVSHQEARKQARTRLNERVRSAAKVVLDRIGLSPFSRDLVQSYPGLGTNNLATAILLLNRLVNRELGVDRNDRESATRVDLVRVHDEIDRLVDELVNDLETES